VAKERINFSLHTPLPRILRDNGLPIPDFVNIFEAVTVATWLKEPDIIVNLVALALTFMVNAVCRRYSLTICTISWTEW